LREQGSNTLRRAFSCTALSVMETKVSMTTDMQMGMKEFRGRKLCRWERLTCFWWAASCYICEEQPLTGVYRKTAPAANPSLLPIQVNLQQPGLAFQTTEDTVCYTRLHQTLSLTLLLNHTCLRLRLYLKFSNCRTVIGLVKPSAI
jgi:hypothetical protein